MFHITCLTFRPRNPRDRTISSENTRYARVYPDGCSAVLGEGSEMERQPRARWKRNINERWMIFLNDRYSLYDDSENNSNPRPNESKRHMWES